MWLYYVHILNLSYVFNLLVIILFNTITMRWHSEGILGSLVPTTGYFHLRVPRIKNKDISEEGQNKANDFNVKYLIKSDVLF